MSSYGARQEPDVSSSTDINHIRYGLILGASLNLNTLLSEYPFSQYSHNGSWGFNIGILRNPVQSLCPMFSLLEFMPIFFFKMEFQYVAHDGLKLNPSASAFGLLGF